MRQPVLCIYIVTDLGLLVRDRVKSKINRAPESKGVLKSKINRAPESKVYDKASKTSDDEVHTVAWASPGQRHKSISSRSQVVV